MGQRVRPGALEGMSVKLREEKKRLVFFDCITHFGGSGQVTLRTIKEMQKHCEVLVLDAYGVCKEYHDALKRFKIANQVLLSDAKYCCIGGSNFLSRASRVLAGGAEMLKLIGALKKKVAEIQPDAIWTTSNKGLFYLLHAVGKDVPVVFFAHGEKSYPRWYNRRRWKRVPLVAGVCEGSFQRLRGSRYEPPMMEVIYNGIEIDETVEQSLSLSGDLPSGEGVCILQPASLTENKNQSMSIKGLAEYVSGGGNACLWLAGDYTPGVRDAYARSLPGLAEELNVSDKVHFLGWRNDVPALMAASDVVVLVSYSEGLPMVFLEAMCLKKPVIATRVGGIPEVVRDGVDGILIEPGDHKAFAGAIAKLSDRRLREKMGQEGFERVKSFFDMKVTARRFLDAIGKIC